MKKDTKILIVAQAVIVFVAIVVLGWLIIQSNVQEQAMGITNFDQVWLAMPTDVGTATPGLLVENAGGLSNPFEIRKNATPVFYVDADGNATYTGFSSGGGAVTGSVGVTAPTAVGTATPALYVDSPGVSNLFEVRDAATPVVQIYNGGNGVFSGGQTVNNWIKVAAPTAIATATPAAVVDSLGVSNLFEVRDGGTMAFAINNGGDVEINGTTPMLTIGDAGAEDTSIVYDGNAVDFYVALDDSADDLLIGYGATVGTDARITVVDNLTTTTVLIGDAQEADMQIAFDGNAQDFHIGLDDTADDLVIGLGTALGTTTALAIDENLVTTWSGGTILLAETATTTDTLTAAECGKTLFIIDNMQVVLPAASTVAAGCEFRFVNTGTPTYGATIITGNSTEDILAGGINELEVDTNDDGPYDANADTITFVAATSVIGDFVYMISDGSLFYVSGQANADGGVTITDSD